MSDSKPLHIVITGASRGLGRAMVEQCIAAGHRVSACARNSSSIEAMRNKWPAPHHFEVVDVADPQSVNSWCKGILERTGAPDFLINNAAGINQNAPLWEVPYEEFHSLVNTNITAVFNVIRQFLPAMIKADKGVVINFSSEWGRSVSADVAPYCATKWAIEGMTKALAADLQQVRQQTGSKALAAIALSPGVVNTDMLQSCFGTAANNYSGADEWAVKAVPYILSLSGKDNGSSVTTPG